MSMFSNKRMLEILLTGQQMRYIVKSHDRIGNISSYTVAYQCLIHHSIGSNRLDWAKFLYQKVYNSRMYLSFQLLQLTLRMQRQNHRLINRIITGLVQDKKRLCEMFDKFNRFNLNHKIYILLLFNNSRH